MAAPPVTGAIAPSRYSLFDRINHISTDNDQLFDLIEELEKHAETAVRWRWHAATTQVKQDSIFKLYQAFLTGVRIITEDLNEQAKEIAIFPANKDNCLKRIRLNQPDTLSSFANLVEAFDDPLRSVTVVLSAIRSGSCFGARDSSLSMASLHPLPTTSYSTVSLKPCVLEPQSLGSLLVHPCHSPRLACPNCIN
ncbi:LOW QUALITY PROTEIN: hypothetical protein FGSG_13559 [Fusarium graminearum PH-1]|uniref:hypothetical protein n=1 Tax=Gibberella zeae (strain ATCC MYA-4620 / CBS 123657 / FGSC 9075 / NRRL 31084 / PH-1) TaxID=229533 RepID=UPI00021F140F|nr:LOW QUALITY PROTEIN: hypothetical protein FGSG_13559 [Fusarium graminearum PH-1]ESU15896.1 LOW QUALITY PROTEIN: hypothetical protein FGSG_13559 [Fusarium graminearum PH-1]|eukprot:XP_011328420.1 LOW QUALITY PROTEIN: hypothetical protein FGSG_13559 [Fusarium graminearum PH-1]